MSSFKQTHQQLHAELQELKKVFELYFSGQERRAPLRERDAFKRKLRELSATRINNTAEKFLLQNLRSQFATYEARWERTVRQIEEGTYHKPPKSKDRAPMAKIPEKTEKTEKTVDNLLAEYNQLSEKNTGKAVNRDSFASALLKKRKEVQDKYQCNQVSFSIEERKGQVIIVATPVKK